MSKRFFGMLVACVVAFASTAANADTPCGCGQVVAPCGDCYGSSVVDPYSAGGIVYDGMSGGISYGGGVAVDGGAGFAGGIVDGGAIVGGGEVIGSAGAIAGGGGCCGQSVRYETRTIYQSQMTTQMRTVTRTRMRTETRTQNYTCLLYTSPSPRDRG